MKEYRIDLNRVKELYLNTLGGICIVEKDTDEVRDYDRCEDINDKFIKSIINK